MIAIATSFVAMVARGTRSAVSMSLSVRSARGRAESFSTDAGGCAGGSDGTEEERRAAQPWCQPRSGAVYGAPRTSEHPGGQRGQRRQSGDSPRHREVVTGELASRTAVEDRL